MTIKKPNPKRQYKNAIIKLDEVENGFSLSIEWAFSANPDSSHAEDHSRYFIAATEKEALELARNFLLSKCAPEEDEEE